MPTLNITVKDITPPSPIVHQLVVKVADVPAFFASIDKTAPEGKIAIGFSCRVAPGGDLDITITYKP